MRGIFIGLLCLLAWGSVARADLKAVSPNVTSLANLPSIATGTILGNSSGSTAAPSALTGATVLPTVGLQSTFSIDNYSPHADGSTDDSTALNAALTACSTAGGGEVLIGPHRYYIASNITVPTGCKVRAPSPLLNLPNGSFALLQNSILLNPANTITMNYNSGWSGVSVFNSALNPNPQSIRDDLTIQQSLSGTAFRTSRDVTIEYAFIAGFGVGIDTSVSSPNGGARLHATHLNIDATNCINAENIHDVPYFAFINCDSLLTANTFADATYAVSTIANNGSGLYRVTLSSPSTVPATGDTMWVTGSVGANSANNRWTVTVIDSTHIDLQGSVATGASITGNTTNNSAVITNVSSFTAAVAVGAGITGTGIPASTTIKYIWPNSNSIVLSANATATNTGTALTISDAAYASGATINSDAQQRFGDGFTFQTSEGPQATNLFANDHTIGFHVTTAGLWVECAICTVDGDSFLNDPNLVGIQIDSTSKGASFVGGYTQIMNRALVINNTGGDPNSIVGMELNLNSSGAVVAEVDQGSATLTGLSNPGTAPVLIGDGITHVAMSGNNLNNTLYFQTTTGYNKFIGVGNNVAANTLEGNYTHSGVVALGRVSTTACAFFPCSVNLQGPLYEGIGGTTTMTNAGTDSVSGNISSSYLHAASPISTYTITMPVTGSSNAGQLDSFFFDADVDSLTWNGGTSIGGPAAVRAGTDVICQMNSTGTTWVCGAASPYPPEGTKFTTSGCSISSTTGGATSGIFTLGANSCTAVLTMGAGAPTVRTGWTCQAHDRTAPTVLIGGESSSTTTTASITIPAGAGATDVISFSCTGY